MPLDQLLSRLALAFGIGLLIGLERGWHSRNVRAGGRTAGVRTFTISGLLGGITAALTHTSDVPLSVAGAVLLGSVLVAFTCVMLTFERDENRAANSFSATTTIAAMLTFMLGAGVARCSSAAGWLALRLLRYQHCC